MRFAPSRRLFLRSAAATVALPLLESALPRDARADLTAPKRLVFWYVPNGIQYENDAWKPADPGALADLATWPTILSPLAPVANKISLLSGIANLVAIDLTNNGDHARGTGSFLTSTVIRFTGGSDILNGISADQLAAASLATPTPLPSLQLGMEPVDNTGTCNAGYSCAYTRNLAWIAESTPLPNVIDPKVAFDRLFPMAGSSISPQEQDRLNGLRKTVLDSVLDQANALSARVSTSDKAKLDEYLDAVFDLGVRIDAMGGTGCDAPEEPIYGGDLEAQARVMADLQVLAMQCDLTRVVTFMMANSGSNRSFDFLGVPGSHHELSHHQGDASKIAQLQVINQWEVEQFAYFVQRLDATADVDGNTMLDNSFAMFSSEIQDGNDHTHVDLPIVLAGTCGFQFNTGWFRRYGGMEPISNLYLSMLQAWGLDLDSFGDSTGPIDYLPVTT